MEYKHSPLPWSVTEPQGAFGWEVVDGHGSTVCMMQHHPAMRKAAESDSAFIVRACNSHYELVEALELVLLTVDFSGSTMEKSIRSVLAKAKGEM